ncbi:M48 family metallopeptidase [Candidatus Woesearchaeota archaeon]|nr:M48 family metallopeptidase [Candidatus Woesearchaeota archaeon]
MNLAERAFSELFPEKKSSRQMVVKYSRAFNAYNANVKYTAFSMTFSLSRQWKKVGSEIQIGLIQSLLLKVYKEKKNTINIDLYNKFIKSIGDYSEVTESDPVLEQSFNRVNEKYFYGMLDKPNLKWGGNSFSKLGTYEYGANMVTISSIFKAREDDKQAEELLDYIMYHELLHKKHKFSTKNGRSYHHTKHFREKEKAFENPNIEDELKKFLNRKSIRHAFTPRKKSWIMRFF